jgi:hypothetical protein
LSLRLKIPIAGFAAIHNRLNLIIPVPLTTVSDCSPRTRTLHTDRILNLSGGYDKKFNSIKALYSAFFVF